MTLPACNFLNFESSNLNSSNQKMKSIGYFERSSTFFALRVETHVGYIDEAASISHGMVMRMIDAVDILENNCEIDSLANQRWSHYYKRL